MVHFPPFLDIPREFSLTKTSYVIYLKVLLEMNTGLCKGYRIRFLEQPISRTKI